MKEHFVKLFEYDKWATARVLGAMKQLQTQDERCLEWMGHLLTARLVWHARVENIAKTYNLWGGRTLEECLSMFEESSRMWEAFISKLDEKNLATIIAYKNFKGDSFENRVEDILTHVINHSTYHRGQIIAQLKGQLPSLPSTDYILFIRELGQ